MLYHLEAHGRAEGRLHVLSEQAVEMDTSRLDGGRPTIILVLASAQGEDARLGHGLVDQLKLTGNVVVVLQRGGHGAARLAASASALVGPLPAEVVSDAREARAFAARLARRYRPRYVLANGFQSQALAGGLREAGAPVVALIHQFPDRRPYDAVQDFYDLSDAVVFPSEALRQESIAAYGMLQQRRTYAVPNGPSDRTFDMEAYAQSLDEIGTACAKRAEAVRLQADHLAQAGVTLDGYFRSAADSPSDAAEAARRYLQEMRSVDFTGPAVTGRHPRRALPGFHPFVYARMAPDYQAGRDGDPLVHFTQAGRPAGPWTHEVIRLNASRAPTAARPTLRAAIHGHFHYTDNIDEFLQALKANTARTDLFLTTTSESAAARLRRVVGCYASGAASVEITPNMGRDIGPFIQLLNGRLKDYDVVGHVHGKRSIHTLDHDADFGKRWREFLWRHLIGPSTPVVDVVLAEFARNPRLGLVFPENEQFIGWEQNRASAAALAPRLKLKTLPEHIDFPAGTMFWARPEALNALLEARLKPEDYPPEPLPDDGTMLHALERLLPLIVQNAGFDYATTYDPRLTRMAKARA